MKKGPIERQEPSRTRDEDNAKRKEARGSPAISPPRRWGWDFLFCRSGGIWMVRR